MVEELTKKEKRKKRREINIAAEQAEEPPKKKSVVIADETTTADEGEVPVVEEAVEEEFHFTVLGGDTASSQPHKPARKSEWIANAEVVTSHLETGKVPIEILTGLDDKIVKRLVDLRISHFFPVQKLVIPQLVAEISRPQILVQPRDFCVSAPTGSGKTLCYVIPIIQYLLNCRMARVTRQIRALVMVPVQELATQVHQVFLSFTQGTHLKEISSLYNTDGDCLADLLIATPGRLVDHLHEGSGMSLKYLRFLVIDEADRMMADAKLEWLSDVERAVYGDYELPDGTDDGQLRYQLKRVRPGVLTFGRLAAIEIPLQKILLSATLSEDPERLHQLNLFQPKLFTVERDRVKEEETIDEPTGSQIQVPDELLEQFVVTKSKLKPLAIHHLLSTEPWARLLCFSSSRESSHRLSVLMTLLGHANVKEFSAGIQLNRRQRTLEQFRSGKVRMLICSDVLARGLDVDEVDCVINYESPHHWRSYVHRVGRTARAGRPGVAVTLLLEEELEPFKKIMESVSHFGSFRQLDISGESLKQYDTIFTEALIKLRTQLEEEKKRKWKSVSKTSGKWKTSQSSAADHS